MDGEVIRHLCCSTGRMVEKFCWWCHKVFWCLCGELYRLVILTDWVQQRMDLEHEFPGVRLMSPLDIGFRDNGQDLVVMWKTDDPVPEWRRDELGRLLGYGKHKEMGGPGNGHVGHLLTLVYSCPWFGLDGEAFDPEEVTVVG